ncbi:MAG: hypothetical protein RL885_25815 [Planctomycetota bacterium]
MNSPSADPQTDTRQLIHELRNAVHAILTSNHCLARCDEIPREYQSFVEAVEKNGNSAKQLLDQLDQSLAKR